MASEEITHIRQSLPFPVNGEIAVSDEPGMGFMVLQWLAASEHECPPYWSRARDRWLRDFVRRNGPLKAAVNTFVNKVVTIPWQINALDRGVYRQVRQARILEQNLRRNSGSMSSSPIKGFKNTLKAFVYDYLTTDNGAFMAVLGPGEADGPIIGAPTGMLHLDSALCTRTKDPEYPVKYFNGGRNGDGREYKIHYTRLIEMANLPAPDVDLNGVGLCAVSCCVEAAQELWDIWRYSAEMFGSRPPRQILYAETGATVKNLEDAIRTWQLKLDNQGRTHFGGTLLAAPRLSSQELRLKQISLATMPENYDRRDVTTINKSEIAAAFGLDLRDLSYTLGAPSRTGDAEVQDRKGRGKGVGEFIETFTERMEEVYLNSDLFAINFDHLDDEQDQQRSEIRDKRSQARERDLRSGITTVRVEREQMWEAGEITQGQFEDMELLDGRLPDGLDVLLLFQSQDSEYQEWLDLDTPDPTDTKGNDPAAMIDSIHIKYIEVSERVHEDRNPEKRRKARQALAALDKLRTLYETQSMDDQMAEAGFIPGTHLPTQPPPAPGEPGQPKPSAPAPANNSPPNEKAVATKALSEVDFMLEEYGTRFEYLIRRAEEEAVSFGSTSYSRFRELLADTVTSILLALFLRGARKQAFAELTQEEQAVLQTQTQVHLASIRSLADDLYDASVPIEDRVRAARVRIPGWLNIAAGLYFEGQTFRADDPHLTWRYGLTEHCSDCLRLHDQVHTASEWRAAGWTPRTWRLACHGIHCQCVFVETQGPSRGAF